MKIRLFLTLLLAFSIFLISCGNHSSRKTESTSTFLDRTIAEFATKTSGMDEKIKFDRSNHSYRYYLRSVYQGESGWSEDYNQRGTFEEENNHDGTVTCYLRLLNEDNETFGTINKVIINLNDGTAIFCSISNSSKAYDVSSE